MKRFSSAVVGAALVALGLTSGAGAAPKFEAKNASHVGQVKYTGGTELAKSGDFLYSGELNGDTRRDEKPEKGGVHIFKVGKGGASEVGFFKCPGNDNDVEVVRSGLVAVGHHVAQCNPAEQGTSNAGLYLLDVSSPSKPQLVGSLNLPSGMQSHTIRPYPGKPLIYVNPGGLPSNGRTFTHFVDVSNPAKPEIVGTFTPGLPTGCHDFSFHISGKKKLGFCAGYGAFSIWDVSDPLAPVVLSRVSNPQIQFNHYATASSDGKLLAIDDEAFAFHECSSGNSPTGRVWIYDISNPAAPVLKSSYGPPRGGDSTDIGHYAGWVPSWCLSHGLDWEPGTHNLAVTWFTGGVSVFDVGDGSNPKEIAYFQASDAATYSALWHKGFLFTNDMHRGLDALRIKG